MLPLQNISPDPNDEYFADGLTEELISTMSKIGGLKVIARTSVMRYKGGGKGIDEIARELMVGTILEGSVRKASDKLRITVQLIDSETSDHIWSESYDREMKDVFAVQADISQTVADTLKVKLLDEEKARMQTQPTKNTEAHALYLKGLYYGMNEYTSEAGLMKSNKCFERAIELDPSCASAYAWLSDNYSGLVGNGFWSLEKGQPYAEMAAAKSLELDPNLAEAHRSMAFLKYLKRDWKGAEVEVRKAIDLNPNDSWNHSYCATIMLNLGRLDDAAAEIRIAWDLAPLDRFANQTMGAVLYYQRRYKEAVEYLERARELDQEFALFSRRLGRCYIQLSQFDKAIKELRKVVDSSKGKADYPALSSLAVAYAKAGRPTEAAKILEGFKDISRKQRITAFAMAQIDVALGQRDEAIDLLETAYEDKDYDTLDDLKFDPMYDDIRSDPRFIALLKKVESQNEAM